jgi:hypothetical protein
MNEEKEDEEEKYSSVGELFERVAEVASEASSCSYQRIDAGIVDGQNRGEALRSVNRQW